MSRKYAFSLLTNDDSTGRLSFPVSLRANHTIRYLVFAIITKGGNLIIIDPQKGESMMQRKSYLVVLSFLVLSFAGCAQTQEAARTKTGQGAAIGAATGALAGAIIGHQSGNRGTGAIIGGLAGAAIGGGIGYKLDQQAKELQRIKDAEVRREQDRLVVTMSGGVLFDVGSATLIPTAMDKLAQMAGVLVRYPENDILVKGYTDNTGSESYNQGLSGARHCADRHGIWENP
jgi:outer membrane protein OmpA-like peptidoglycan-associated protein